MSFLLGNMSISQIEREYGFNFTEEERERLKETHHEYAHFEEGESGWHMFDIPQFLVVSPDEVGKEVIDIFMRHSDEMSGSFNGGYAY